MPEEGNDTTLTPDNTNGGAGDTEVNYESFNIPDGSAIDHEGIATVAKDISLTQEQAQKLIDLEVLKPSQTVDIPEQYEAFTVPEGSEVNQEEVSRVAKDMGLTQEQAQKLSDAVINQAKEQETLMQGAIAQWSEDVKNDSEIGGADYQTKVAIAVKAVNKFGTPELTKFLKDSGMEGNPELIRFCYRIGKSISEDTLNTGSPPKEEGSIKSMYPNSNHN